MMIPVPLLMFIAVTDLLVFIVIYRCGFVAGSEATNKLGLDEVKRRFEAKWWRLGI